MQSVLIADDEMAVCNLINHLISWEELELTGIGYAHDGIQAYQIIMEKKPDIVITDIRMPGLDGLELIEKIRKENQAVSFIIVSGYQEFEFAKQALRFGVEDYLVKPIKEDELNSILRHVQEKRELGYKKEKNETAQQVEMNFLQENLRKTWLFHLIKGEGRITQETIIEINQKYCFHFCPGVFHALAIQVENDRQEGWEDNREYYIERVQKYISQELNAYFFDYESVIQGNQMIYLINGKQYSKEALKERLGKVIAGIRLQSEEIRNMVLTIAVSEGCDSIEDCRMIIRQAQYAICMRWWNGKNQFYWAEEISLGLKKGSLRVRGEEREKLLQLIEVFDGHKIYQWSLEMLENYQKELGKDYVFLADIVLDIMRIIRDKILEWKGIHENNGFFQEDYFIRQMNDCRNWSEVLQLLGNAIDFVVQAGDERKQMLTALPIRIVRQYLEENYSNRITLEEMADIVHLSPVYLSSLFKKETGMNFSDYLVHVRVDRAKILLKEVKWNVSEVAHLVGYTDSRHFSKTFSKVVGISPKEYRRLHS